MPRYAVLMAPEGEGLPVGVVVQREGHVHVEAIDEYSLPTHFDEAYRVLERDLTEVQYTPEDPGYFDQVLVELSRHVRVGEQGELPDASSTRVIELVQDKVLRPRLAARRRYGAKTLAGSYRQQWAPDDRFVHATTLSSEQLQLDDGCEDLEHAMLDGHAFRLAA